MSAYAELLSRLREAQTLVSVTELLDWDQETMMPGKAASFRAEGKALLSRLIHERATDPRLGQLLAECESDDDLLADGATAANLRELRRDFDRASKLPVELVAEASETSALAMEAWKEARERSDFRHFEPWLAKQIVLGRRKAECWGAPPGGELYDALLDEYEPDTTSVLLERVFIPLRARLTELRQTLEAAPRRPAPLRLSGVRPPREQLHAFNVELLGRLGFDLGAGRLDVSTHPFSSGIGPGDTRLTTRYHDDAPLESIGTTLHEAGHALYEQGLPDLVGQPLGEPLGLAIHESQSRLWENHVGRSREFCRFLRPELARALGGPWAATTEDALYQAVNVVKPNLIRVESDEVTYHLHVMLRFDLERAMIRGDLRAADLPGAWNERMRADLGLDVPDDRRGCLQDVHWSMGAIGYFPTYTLGSLYAAQFWEALSASHPGVPEEIARGEFATLLRWLRASVHAHGRRFPASELCRRISGGPLSHEPLLRHLNRKLRGIYGIDGGA